MLPLLLPIVTTLAPDLVNWLFGAKAEKTASAVAQVVQTVTGADPSTEDGAAAVQAMIAGKPDIALQLQQQLLTVRAQMQAEADREADAQREADLAAMQTALTNTAGARQQTIDLAKAGSPIAWGAPIVSAAVLITFAIVSTLVMTHSLPPGSEPLTTNILVSLQTMATAVVAYWTGSSVGSAKKDATIANLHAVNAQLAAAAP